VAVCCSVWQCVAVCCSALQCVAALCCIVLQCSICIVASSMLHMCVCARACAVHVHTEMTCLEVPNVAFNKVVPPWR